MSAIESIATPVRPTSPTARSSSESYPSCVGRSNATETPCWPPASRYRKRAFVSSAEAKPAYWRIVHGRRRYMSRYGPRVNGAVPGGSSRSGASPGVYTGLTSIPDSVSRRSTAVTGGYATCVRVTVRLFAGLRERAGWSQKEIDAETVGDVWRELGLGDEPEGLLYA